MQKTVVEVARDGTLKLPPGLSRNLGGARELSIMRIGTSLVLAPIPEKWKRVTGRVVRFQNGMIVRDPKVMFGTPVIAGTRIPVRTVVGYVEAGYAPEQIRKEFPQLTDMQIEAALKFFKDPRAQTKKNPKRARRPH